MRTAIFPGGTLGILGGGQLGRMLCLEARRMGYRTVVWSGTEVAEPVEAVADVLLAAGFEDQRALERFVGEVDVATVEFENIPLDVLERVGGEVPLRPGALAVGICQHREREKTFLKEKGIACTPFRLVCSAEELIAGLDELGGSGVLKTAEFGYDGRGQVRVNSGMELAEVWEEFDAPKGVLEKWVEFEREISVMIARGVDGSVVCYDPAENIHRSHVLDHSIVPARVSEELGQKAQQLAKEVVEAMDYMGLMGVEFFVSADGGLLVNEMAPRPHNSGHHTMDACMTSQFEQQLRAVCGLSLGEVALQQPVVMLNLLGDLWQSGKLHAELSQEAGVRWHYYGKSRYEGLRKCGHVNFLGDDALGRALLFKERLLG